MVVTKLKFICGEGDLTLHYCDVCGAPNLCMEEAEECERGHRGQSEESGEAVAGKITQHCVAMRAPGSPIH